MQALFDRIAAWSSDVVSRAPFFSFCVLSIVIWLPSFPLWENAESWQLPINTFTTVVTFLLVALLQNAQRRTERALHRKLDAIADGLADLMHHTRDASGDDIEKDIDELRHAVSVELEPSDDDHDRQSPHSGPWGATSVQTRRQDGSRTTSSRGSIGPAPGKNIPVKGDRVEILVDAGEAVRTFELTARRAGRHVETTTGRGVVEVTEVTRTGQPVRTARFMATRVIAVVEHPAASGPLAGQPPDVPASSDGERRRRETIAS